MYKLSTPFKTGSHFAISTLASLSYINILYSGVRSTELFVRFTVGLDWGAVSCDWLKRGTQYSLSAEALGKHSSGRGEDRQAGRGGGWVYDLFMPCQISGDVLGD